jgi:hypothetical protein
MSSCLTRHVLQTILQNFLPFISLFTGGNADTQISMADMVNRIKHASHLMCWNESSFYEPIHAYLKRKLRHVSMRVERDLQSLPMQPQQKMLLLENGSDYYATVGEMDECGRMIYFPAKLVSFKISFGVITVLVQTTDDNGKIMSLLLKISTSHAGSAFVPKAEFEAEPLGVVCKYMTTTLETFTPPPTDWSAYENDMKEILTCLAAGFPNFKIDSTALSSTGRESPFSISNATSSLQFTEVDHGMSFQPFFPDKMASCSAKQRDKLLSTSALREINRCFFIHLGVALGFHPVAMQAIFRAHSDALLNRIHLALSQKTHEDDQRFDEVKMLEGALQSVLRRNDMIEAPILSIIWPQEFQVRPNIAANFSPQTPSPPPPPSLSLSNRLATTIRRSCRTFAYSFSLLDALARSQIPATCSVLEHRQTTPTLSMAPTSS